MKTREYKKNITQALSTISDSPQLEVDILFMHVLQKTRAELLLTDEVSETTKQRIDALVIRRQKGEPLAYIIGTQPFWTMELLVTPDTLIPRADTECLIEWILQNHSEKDNYHVADLGTGTGAIAIALALEKPHWRIDATDMSANALAIAKKNAAKYAAHLSFYQGDWGYALPDQSYDIIVSNPPYIAENDHHLAQLHCEPQSALVSGKKGLDAITIIASQALAFLVSGGTVVIEHGYDQAEAVYAIFKNGGYVDIQNHHDLSGNPRFVTGKKE